MQTSHRRLYNQLHSISFRSPGGVLDGTKIRMHILVSKLSGINVCELVMTTSESLYWKLDRLLEIKNCPFLDEKYYVTDMSVVVDA